MTEDMLTSLAKEGKALSGVTVIDAHMHSARVAPFFSRFDNGADMIAQMDLIGVDRGIVSELWSVKERWDSFGRLKEFCSRAQGRIFAYSAPHPDWEDFEKALEEQASYAWVVGIKLHPALHLKPFDCRQYRFAYEYGAAAGLPVLLHVWGTADVMALAALADEYRGTDFIFGHSGGEEDAVAMAAKVASERSNVYLDTACSYVWQGAIEHMVSVAGAEKILYGSDAYWNSMEVAIGRVLFADISEEDKLLILGQNAKRLFRWGAPQDGSDNSL